MSRDSIFGSFLRGIRERLTAGNRKSRRAQGGGNPHSKLLGFDTLEGRIVPAIFYWRGYGALQGIVNNVVVDLGPQDPRWSNPANWAGGVVPSGPGHDLIFDHIYTQDFDTTPGSSSFDLVDSDPSSWGSFFGVNDLSAAQLPSVRSMTINGSVSTLPAVWTFDLEQTAPATVLGIEVQAGVRTNGSVILSQTTNFLSINLRNLNGVTGFNFSNAPGSQITYAGNIDMFDPVAGVGGLLTCFVGATPDAIYDIAMVGTIVGGGLGDGSRVLYRDNNGSAGDALQLGNNTYNGSTTIEGGVDLFLGGTLGIPIGFTNPTGGTFVKPNSFLDILQDTTVPVGEDITLDTARLGGDNNATVNSTIFLLGPSRIGVDDLDPTTTTGTHRTQFYINGQITDANFAFNDLTFETGTDIDSYIILSNPTNNYRGSTIVGGTRLLKLAPSNGVGDVLPFTGVIPDTSRVILLGGASIDVNNFFETIGSIEGTGNVFLGVGRLTVGQNNLSTLYSGRISSAIVTSDLQGGLTKIGTGVLTLSGSNNYTGQTLINQGTIRIGSNVGVIDDQNRVTVGNLATFDLNNFDETIGSVVGLGGSSRITLGAGTLTTGGNNLSTDFEGIITGSGGITKRGTGIFGLLGANTYTGATAIKGGVLQIKNLSERLSDVTAVTVDPGALFDLNNFNETIGSLAGGILLPGTDPSQYGLVTLGSGNLKTGGNGTSTLFAGRINGTGAVTKVGNGTWTLLNTNTFSGVFLISAGTVVMGDSSSGVLATSVPNVSTNVTVASGARLTGDGRVLGNVTINSGATLTPNSPLVPEPLDIDGDLTMLAGSTYIMQIGDQLLYSRMTVTGAVNIGTAVVTLQTPISASYVPTNNAKFVMIVKGGTAPITNGIFALPGSPTRPLPEGSYININGNLFRITYSREASGVVGNDVILTGLINTAPVYDGTPPNPQLTSILEDQDINFNFGDTVASILGSRVTDPDIFAVKGLAVIGFGGTAGQWQYRLNTGPGTFTAWTNFGAVSQSSAFLLRDVDMVRFLPAANANGIGTMLFRAWDQTNGLPGTSIDISAGNATGGQSAFSAVIGTAEVSVIAVNDAPVNTLPAGPISVVEETPKSITGIAVADVDAATGKLTISLHVTHGILTINTNVIGGLTAFDVTSNGTPTVILVGTLSQLNATLSNASGVTYLGNNLYFGPDVLTMTTSDNGNTGIGGTLTDTDSVDINIIHKNHAPILDGSVTPSLTPINEDNINSVGNLVSFANPYIVDIDSIDLKGIAIVGVSAVIAGDTGPLSGTWQYSTNGGATWTSFPVVSGGNALVLRDTDRVRFQPQSNKNGTVSITYKAWDRSDNAAPGTTIDASGGGGSSSVSTATQTATLTVLPINDAPTGVLPAGPIVVVPGVLTTISPISVGDVEADFSTANIRVTLSATRGTITVRTGIASGLTSAQISGNGTANVVITAPTVIINKTFGSVNGVRYTASGGFVGADTISMLIADLGSSGSGGPLTTLVTTQATAFDITDVVGRDQATGNWWVGKNTGSGFSNQYFGTWSPSINWQDVLVGDFNRDGFARDIAGRDPTTGQWWVAISDGTKFTNQYMGQWSVLNWTNVVLGDFNRDGFADDIAGRDPTTGTWWVARGNGTSFTNVAFGTWTNSVTWVDVKVGNFSNSRYADGRAIPCDIMGRISQTGQWWGALSLNGNSFTNRLYGAWSTAVTWVDVNVTDIDGDGFQDDMVGRIRSNGQWWALKGNGISAIPQLLGAWSSAINWTDVRFGDFDNDGFVNDIAGRNPTTGQWQVSTSDGFTLDTKIWATWTTGTNWVDVIVGDFNGDGKKGDIAGRDRVTGLWRVLVANGTTTFTDLTNYGQWTPSVNWVDVRGADFA